ncbi:winged helix DNA-binding protein [bacterium 210917-SL.2.15]|nr:winged helix DNA-binding protein [bacterium 210917-SL.2.15]
MKTKNDAGERLLSAWLTLSSTLWNERIVTGMTFNEAFVCNLLSRQDAAQPLTATDLCQRTKLLKSQMNKVLSEMERKGYVQRMRSEKDKRQVLLRLTEAGQTAYAKEHSGISEILHRLVEDLGEEKALHAADIVEEITQSLEKIETL